MADNKVLERTTRGVSNRLFDEWDALNAGESTYQKARATASLANAIMSNARLEMDFARFVHAERSEDNQIGHLSPLTLGN